MFALLQKRRRSGPTPGISLRDWTAPERSSPGRCDRRASNSLKRFYTAVCLGGVAASGWDLPTLSLLDDSSGRQAPRRT